MVELRIGSFLMSFGRRLTPQDILIRRSADWQSNATREVKEARQNPEAYVAQKACPHGCGWWTAVVTSKNNSNTACIQVTLDIGRHLYHDCPSISNKQRAEMTPCPLPSH